MDDDDGFMLNFAPASIGGSAGGGGAGGGNRGAKRKAVHDVASNMKGTWKRRRMAARKIIALDKKKMKDNNSNKAGPAAASRDSQTAPRNQERPTNHNNLQQSRPAPSLATAEEPESNGPKSRKELRGKTRPPGQAGGDRTNPGVPSGNFEAEDTSADAPRPWITSLFSANPSPVVKEPATEPESEESEVEAEPVFDTKTFRGLGLNPFLSAHIAARVKAKRPTAIQSASIPVLGGTRKASNDRDAIIQAQTGSGKTLAYLLPIINTLMNIEDRGASRRSGCFAIVLAPTRELARQIYDVLEDVLNFSAKSTSTAAKKSGSDSDSDSDSSSDDEDDAAAPTAEDKDLASSERRPRWIVPGLVVGGDNKKSEKARLRKGINILVSTPGRLLDHLRNTKALNVSKVRWLVLDEADRLMDLGFEETIREILGALKREGKVASFLESWAEVLPKRRVTWLCSATMKGDTGLERLQEMSVEDPVVLVDKSKEGQSESSGSDSDSDADSQAEPKEDGTTAGNTGAKEELLEGAKISVPNQLRQSYLVAPAKLRLVVLMALLRQAVGGNGGKVIVFVSCQDSVDFLWTLLGHLGAAAKTPVGAPSKSNDKLMNGISLGSDDEGNTDFAKLVAEHTAKAAPPKPKTEKDPVSLTGGILPNVPLFRLHGNMPQGMRTSTFQQFTRCETGVLLCTDVAARGLDLPNVSYIIQYDPPADFKDYVHRAGRTARLGRAGKAIIMLLPSEVEYLDVLSKEGFSLHAESTDGVLENLVKASRTGSAKWKKVSKEEMEKTATDVHMEAERWVMGNSKVSFEWNVGAYRGLTS